MLPKKHRLNKSAEVRFTTLKGRSFFNPFFVIKVLPNQEMVKMTVIASVKVSKKAVTRNRLKRLIRHYFQQNIDLIKPGNYAIILKPAAAKVLSTQLLTGLHETIKKGKIIS